MIRYFFKCLSANQVFIFATNKKKNIFEIQDNYFFRSVQQTLKKYSHNPRSKNICFLQYRSHQYRSNI